MKLTSRQLEVLRTLAACQLRWARPMDVGGRDDSHHSKTLKALARRGLVIRRRRNTLMNMLRSRRGSYVYRIAENGRAAIPKP